MDATIRESVESGYRSTGHPPRDKQVPSVIHIASGGGRMHAFRRIKIEVNIGSTTIVSLDPLAGDRFAIPPRFMHDETTASIDERHVRTFVGRYYLSVMMARA